MHIEEQANRFHALDQWFQTAQGRSVAQAFLETLRTAMRPLSGRHLLQLGHCGDNVWLKELSYRSKSIATACTHAAQLDVLTNLQWLPFERNSVDCILAPLTLEAFARDKSPIDEFDRILKPNGYLVVLGVNPWSLWGAAMRWGSLSCFGQASPHFSSALSLKYEMRQRGYDQHSLSMFYYIPPIKNPVLIENLAFMNEMGKMLILIPAGFYCLVVQKKVLCRTSRNLVVGTTLQPI